MTIEYIDSPEQIDLARDFVCLEEDSRYPNQIVVQTFDQEALNARYPQFLSRFAVLIETGMWDQFRAKLEEDGYTIYMMASAERVIMRFAEWSKPLQVANYRIPLSGGGEGTLYPYQQYGIRKAVSAVDGFFFFNWGTGTGKGTAASAGAQELFNQGKIEVVLVFTMRKMKINLTREFNAKTSLTAVNVEGPKAKRAAKFAAADAQVYVLNYEKANFDYEMLAKRIKGRKVLFVLDEVQKILTFTSGTANKAGQGLRKLIRDVKSPYVWPMSATVVGNDPERYWRLFDLPKGTNHLGTLGDFRSAYSDGVITKFTVWGQTEIVKWSQPALEEVRHRIGPWSHSVRKSDPGVRELFKETQFIPVPIQLSDEDRKLYQLVEKFGRADEENWGQYYRVLRYICDTAASLRHSDSEVAKILVERFPDLSNDTSAKLERYLEDVERIRDQGDKIVTFCSFTNMGLFRVSEFLTKHGVRHVIHYGVGMTDKEAQQAQDDFKADPDITVFLSSDAGAMGLNFQEARYVINFDIPYSYDLLRQRSDRIDRVDSYLEGLTVYGYYAEDTVQERIWKINNDRREMASTVQGTEEGLSRLSGNEEDDLGFLMFGIRKDAKE